VHDYNYLMKIIELAEEKLKDSDLRFRYDRDTAISKDSWKASLLSCGSVIKGVDSVM
jgi:acetoin utilization deacetylase AcuC-like enzyme